MANRQSTGGRMTRDERRTQARLDRLALQRKVARAKRNRRIGLALSVLVVAAVGGFMLTRPSPTVAAPAELLRQAEEAARVAGCSAVEDVGPYQPRSEDAVHISDPAQMPALSTYPSVPPASGPHNEVPLGAGVYETAPPIDRVIHSLEHGAAVIWHSPDADGEELDGLRAFYGGPNGARVIVAPYDYPDQGEAGRLPAGTSMALVSWHQVERCAQVSLAAAFDFSSQYSAPPFGQRSYLGEAPEAGAGF
jgi:hypothetical protein